ncbi:hypothetical protein BGZ76_004759 [Entomortierella beljakovae]|nr:hypothetical protein BGZ76_004759 [Entomortierella beljakovae]
MDGQPVTHSNNIATPSNEQLAINEEKQTTLLSEIERITHSCPPQHEESCSTYQLLSVKQLFEYLPKDEDQSISEYEFTVKQIRPVMQTLFQSKTITSHL